jgi:hypothetical protein
MKKTHLCVLRPQRVEWLTLKGVTVRNFVRRRTAASYASSGVNIAQELTFNLTIRWRIIRPVSMGDVAQDRRDALEGIL